MSTVPLSPRPRFARSALWAACLVGLVAAPAAAKNQPTATALVREVEQSALSVRMELRAAREANDTGRARCVSEKLSQVHAQLRTARTQADLLIQPTDVARARRHRYLLEAVHENSRDLAHAARRCDSGRSQAVRVVRR
ncbi:MAG: hypothetical protein HYZ29_02900 [Myxococcales bacterium]|nr:hypothetical protein [Myxococcales bacterium]